MSSSSGKKFRKNPIRTEEGVVFQSEMGFLEFQEEIWNSSFVTGWHYMLGFSGKNCQNDQIRTEGGVAIWRKSEFLKFLEF